jgi:uncharacterized membrane protein
MTTRATHFAVTILTAVALGAGWIVGPALPDPMASHWNLAGEVDGTLGKTAALLVVPGLLAGVYLLFLGLIAILPLRENVQAFRPQLNLFLVGLAVFFSYLHAVSLAWNLGYVFAIEQAVLPGMAVFVFLVGHVLGQAKRNWMFGIRTPWTLSSDAVWERTHRVGGRLFKVAAAFTALGAVLGTLAWLLVLVPMSAAAVYPVAYSYFAYQQEQKASA